MPFSTSLRAILTLSVAVLGALSIATPAQARETGYLDVTRISGVDRFEVALHVAEKIPIARNPVVFVATGQSFPDALSATPVVRAWRAPLLLVTRDSIPTEVAAAIRRIRPVEIKVVGGPASVSPAVIEQLAALSPGVKVERYDGTDRYDVSRRMAAANSIVLDEHGYVATGTSFADALSAGAVAATDLSPLVLVNGSTPSLDTPTRSVLTGNLQLHTITVVGGLSSVGDALATDLDSIAPVERAGGIDRYATSVAVNQRFTKAPTAYLATGLNFPDALTGGVLAASQDAPLYVVPGDCVPDAVLDEFTRLGTMDVVLIGGPASLSDEVFRLTPCR